MFKEELHNLVDALPEREVYSAKRYLQFLLVKVQNQRLLEAFEDAPEEDRGVLNRLSFFADTLRKKT